ncbi:RidA family protein [Myxococcota bacterium]|nr:RidA family protein [Myxococcota bacterium]
MKEPRHELINPEALGKARGYSNGVLAAPGRLLFVAGQVAWDGAQQIVSESFAAQFAQALSNVLTVVREAEGKPEHVARLTIYVTNKDEYVAAIKDVGAAYRERMGKHYPAMALVEVKALLEPGAKVEIEATAVIP